MKIYCYLVYHRRQPPIGTIERFIASEGNFEPKLKVFYRNVGYFVINFKSKEDRNVVLHPGLYGVKLVDNKWSNSEVTRRTEDS